MLKYLLALSVFAAEVSAQSIQTQDHQPAFEVALLGGVSSASLWESELPDLSGQAGVLQIDYDRYEQTSFSRGSSAIIASYWIASPLGIEFGAKYQVRGGTTEDEFEIGGFEADGYTRRTVQMLSIPIGVTIRTMSSPFAIDLGLGLDYAIPLSADVQYHTNYVSPEETFAVDGRYDVDYEDDLGLYGSIAMKYWMSERVGLHVQAGYTHGLTSHAIGASLEDPLNENDRPYQSFRTYHLLAGTSFSF